MLVYGDHSERVAPRARLTEIAAGLKRGQLSHDALTGHFIDLAGITQGIADADFGLLGEDRPRQAESLLLEQLTTLAGILLRSWDQGCSGGQGPALCLPADLPEEVEVRLPEGFAFYALRPEAYGLAARQLQLLAAPRVIGLRSIGAGLACMAAAALGAGTPVTVRPTGDPFDRSLRISPTMADGLLSGDAHFVIVDEGPGLSGSSFGAVADWLEDRGVPADRIAFLPGHGNDLGRRASERHGRRWATAQRPVVVLDSPPRELLGRLLGPLDQPLWDISAGAWRSLRCEAETEWPPVDPMWERRKFLARTDTGAWLVKFAGLGRIGEGKLRLAQTLHEAGVGPEPAALGGGWLVTRWHEDAVPTRPTPVELRDYLRVRAALPAPQPGASPERLLTMARRNIPCLASWSPDLSRLRPQPVCTDNRMAAHEWLRLPSGRLLKADALDHHAGHDLIGCQDIGWDVAGAAVELGLGDEEVAELAAAVGVAPALLDFYLVAYTAFRVGAHRMSAWTLGHWPVEQQRHGQAADRLERRLAAVDPVQRAGHVH